MQYIQLGNSDLNVSRNLSGVMAVNKPVMSEEPVWVSASRNK